MPTLPPDICLMVAGGLAIAVAIGHGLTAELYVFRKSVVQPEAMRTLIRLIWQASTVEWIVIGVVLILTPHLMTGTARLVIAIAAMIVYGYVAVANFIATRGRHPGWIAMLIVVGLCYAGR